MSSACAICFVGFSENWKRLICRVCEREVHLKCGRFELSDPPSGSFTCAECSPDGPRIHVVSGRVVHPIAENLSFDVSVETVAHSLSLQCRYAGHVDFFYSVAQHSVLVSTLVPDEDRKWGLMHDVPECLVQDVVRPLKHSGMFEAYRAAEDRIMKAVCWEHGLRIGMPASVKEADRRIVWSEWRDLRTRVPIPEDRLALAYPQRIEPWAPGYAKFRFLERYRELFR